MKRQLPSSDRRNFLKTSGAVAAGLLTTGGALAQAPTAALPPLPVNARTQAAMPTRNLGRTGYKVGIFSLGGQSALEKPNNFDIAVPIIERALDLGVNYIDTSSIYGGPERWSEQYVGRVKTKERTRDGSLRMIEKSLTLLNTDHVDLWQLHDIGLPEDVNAIFAKGGAMEALLEMQQQKVVRFLGVTGHYRPEALIDAVNRHSFDTILMALNAADAHIHSFTDQLLPLVVEKRMGIIGMKVPSRGRLLSSWTPPPLERQQHSWEGSAIATRPGVMNMRDAMCFTLSHPVSSVIVGCDNIAQLEENVQIARDFTPLSQSQLAALNELAAPVAKQSLFFRFTDRSRG
jgi:aryl-alcohol dehydrogenase-like predicted oxidoreductase